jgi:Yip1 domain
MNSTQILAETFVAPERGLAAAVRRQAALAPILVSTAVALALALLVASRGDYEGMLAGGLDAAPGAEKRTAHDREEQLAQARKLALAGTYAGALFLPALSAAGAALALGAGFRLAGARPGFRASLSAASFGLLPLALRDLLTVPALLRHAPVRPDAVAGLLPSSLAALLPQGAQGPLALAAASVDLFALWSVVLVALGMAHAAGVPTRRALLVTALLWIAWVAVFRVSVPTLLQPAK